MKLSVLGPGEILGLEAPLLTKALEKDRAKSERDKKNSDGADSSKVDSERQGKRHSKHHHHGRHHLKHEHVDPGEQFSVPCKLCDCLRALCSNCIHLCFSFRISHRTFNIVFSPVRCRVGHGKH